MQDLMLKRAVFLGLLFVNTTVLTACSLFQDIWHQDEIAEYGESVFRRQNLITSQIMMLSEESKLSVADSQKLQQAEAQMQKDCKLLNEYATREMENTNIDLLFKKQVKDSIQGCDLSIQKMESLLKELNIKE